MNKRRTKEADRSRMDIVDSPFNVLTATRVLDMIGSTICECAWPSQLTGTQKTPYGMSRTESRSVPQQPNLKCLIKVFDEEHETYIRPTQEDAQCATISPGHREDLAGTHHAQPRVGNQSSVKLGQLFSLLTSLSLPSPSGRCALSTTFLLLLPDLLPVLFLPR